MRNIYFFFAALLSLTTAAQCPPGGLTITSQAQLNTFITTYPDCTQINGDVIIDGVNITSLAGLANIITITGAVEIREVSNLTSLNGLQNLETVGTDFILREVEDLTNIEALTSLTSVGGEFTLRSCPELVSLDGIENVASVGLGLIVRDCESLISIEGLTGVTFVGEILEVVQCPSLTSLAGLENIDTIIGGDEGAIVIEGNDSLTSLEGLGNASTLINNSITISTNAELSYCSVPSICNYLQNIPEGATATFGANVTGCNTEAEVIAECAPLNAPVISTFTPETGCAGSEITINGSGFTGITAVTIGGIPVISYEVVSETEITAIAGPLSTGVVAVTNTSGTASGTVNFTLDTTFPLAPSGNPAQVVSVNNTSAATLADLELTLADGGIVTWYASEEDVLAMHNPLAPGFVIMDGVTYYATQTIGNCTSAGYFAVTVNIVLGAKDFNLEGLSYYPVPVRDVLNISYTSDITSVSVINLLGQQVIRQLPHTSAVHLDMSILQAGVYVLAVTSDTGTATIKIMKE